MRRFSPVAHSAKCSPKPNGVFRGRTNGEVVTLECRLKPFRNVKDKLT
ncbi:Uncharacterised protein [Vibrio cholerae]|nr:Uncharacterised protein [Vibrio cholerae]